MSNEPHWDYILTKNHKKEAQTVKQKDKLETHAKQITQYLEKHSPDDIQSSQDCHDTSLPGVKVPFAFQEPELTRTKSNRSSMRKIPKKSNSIREKKKNSDSEKSKRSWRKSSSPGDIKQMMENAGTTDGVLPRKISAEGTKNEGSEEIATREERPIITSLNAAELMLVSADKGDLGTMQVLIDKPPEDTKSLCLAQDDKGETPLHKAAKNGYLKCLKFLASHVPGQVSCVDKSGLTPAAYAAKNGHVNCLKWLVEESSAYGELAVRDGQMSLLHYSALEGMEQCLSYLLGFMAKRKITTDIIDAHGQTPLHTAAKMGHLPCVQTLVEHGADVLAKDHGGLTSANVAYLEKQSICSRYLLMAESCWILASRVATLYREVNGFKKENKELKKTVENLKSRKKSDLPNRPETVGAHTNDNGGQVDGYSSKESEKASIGPRDRNFPDGESPKSTFTEADKQRPQIISQKNRGINPESEIKDTKHFKVVRQTSNQSDSIPAVSTNAIAEIPPAEKRKAKEIAMVTHQLMSTRHMHIIQDQKSKQVETEDNKSKVSPDEPVTDVVKKRNNYRNRDLRPQSLCDNDLVFMRSATDINFASKGRKLVMERRSSCTEINSQPEQVPLRETASKEDVSKEKNFWDKVGAKKLLSRKKSAKARPHSVALSDLQTVSTDKILELYAQESHATVSGSSSKINSLIWEENELNPSMGLRTMSTIDLKSQGYSREHFSSVHASFRERRSSFQPMADFRMSERFTPSTSKTKDFNFPGSTAEKKIRPVAKPRQRLKTVSNETISGCQQNKESVTANSVERTFKNDITDCSTKRTKNFTSYQTNRSVYGDKRLEDVEEFDARSVETDHSLECTDV